MDRLGPSQPPPTVCALQAPPIPETATPYVPPLRPRGRPNRRMASRSRNSSSAFSHSRGRPRPLTGSASASDGCWQRDTGRDRATSPSPSDSCSLDRQGTRTAHRPRTESSVPTGSDLEIRTRAGCRACAGCSRPPARGNTCRWPAQLR